MQLGALAALYASLTAFLVLTFSLVNILIPDTADSYWEYESAADSIRFAIAILVIIFPVYLWLTRLVNEARRNTDSEYLSLTKWLIYLSLFVAGCILVGDAVSLVYSYLNGELTIRFLLKAIILGVTVAGAFFYYLKDARDYWLLHEKKSVQIGVGALLLVLVAVFMGIYKNETPQALREREIDRNQVYALQSIQSYIEGYWKINDFLPDSLQEADVPKELIKNASERRQMNYAVLDEQQYELCTEFMYESYSYTGTRPYYYDTTEALYQQSWDHDAGWYCFARKIGTNSVVKPVY